MMQRVLLAPATALLLLMTPASAQTSNDRGMALATELVSAMKIDNTFRAVFPAMSAQIVEALAAQNPAIRKDAEDFLKRATPEFIARLSEVTSEAAKIYARKFSAAELSDMLTFMKTTSGQKFIAEQGPISVEMLKVGQDWGQRIAADVIEKMKVELRNKGHRI